MTTPPPSGRTASRNGNQLELFVMHTLEAKGFLIVPYRQWCQRPKSNQDVLVRRVPCQTIYGKTTHTEFVLHSPRLGSSAPIRIECKWQQANGSVDEKFPYMYLNALNAPEPTIVFLIDGGGAKPEAVQWLQNACHQGWGHSLASSVKTLWVWNMSDFFAWVNRNFL